MGFGGARDLSYQFVDSLKSVYVVGIGVAMTDREKETGRMLARSVFRSSRGQVNAANQAVSVVVGLMVAGLVASFLLPIAIEEIVAVDTSNWSSGASELWGMMDLVIVLGAFLVFIGIALAQSGRV